MSDKWPDPYPNFTIDDRENFFIGHMRCYAAYEWDNPYFGIGVNEAHSHLFHASQVVERLGVSILSRLDTSNNGKNKERQLRAIATRLDHLNPKLAKAAEVELFKILVLDKNN